MLDAREQIHGCWCLAAFLLRGVLGVDVKRKVGREKCLYTLP